MSAMYSGESIQPNLLNRINWGTFSTTWGRNRVDISTANSRFFPRNWKRANPYAVTVAEMIVNSTLGSTML